MKYDNESQILKLSVNNSGYKSSPISSINFTEEKSIQCSISRGISPPCYHDKNENSSSISEDLRVIPMKVWYVLKFTFT
jgi:3D (Asp-Asp-Asp) domain-containing protein